MVDKVGEVFTKMMCFLCVFLSLLLNVVTVHPSSLFNRSYLCDPKAVRCEDRPFCNYAAEYRRRKTNDVF